MDVLQWRLNCFNLGTWGASWNLSQEVVFVEIQRGSNLSLELQDRTIYALHQPHLGQCFFQHLYPNFKGKKDPTLGKKGLT